LGFSRTAPFVASHAHNLEPPVPETSGPNPPPLTLEAVSAARWRIAVSLTVAMMVVYFGFILLVAFDKPLLGRIIAPGLSVGVLLGALVIVAAWVLTWIYIRWANTHYDAHLRGLRR
jgi:uncharacterized membrane protein (DUF485 family)